MKYAELSKGTAMSPSLERKMENLVTEPPVKSVNNRELNNKSSYISRSNVNKSNERTPSLQKSKSRSIGKRNLSK